MRILSQSIILIMVCAPALSFGIPINYSYSDDPFKIVIQGTGGTFSKSLKSFAAVDNMGKTTIFTDDGYWDFTLNYTEDPKLFHDLLTITGQVLHLKSPPGLAHINDGKGDPVSFTLTVDSDNASIAGTTTTSDTTMNMAEHGPHTDELTAKLVATVHQAPLGIVTNITDYNFSITVAHCDECPAGNPSGPLVFGNVVPIPEPGILALLSTGLTGLLGYRWRQNK
jgi:hypothetical protein